MDRRQVIALLSLGIVGAGVGGLVLTAGDGDADGSAPPEPAPGDDPAVSQPTSTTGDDADADTEIDADRPVAEPEPAPTTSADPVLEHLDDRGPHRPLTDLDGWLQSDVAAIDELVGKVVAVQFWTFGCFNCKATMPHMQALYAKYPRSDFEIVGVHAPEFDFEKDPDAIAQAAAEQGITWPIALDTRKTNFRSWQEDRRFWPRLYLLDRDGNVRYDHIGEGRYDRHDAAVAALIAGV